MFCPGNDTTLSRLVT